MTTIHPEVLAAQREAARLGEAPVWTLRPAAARDQDARRLERLAPGPEVAAVHEVRVPVGDATVRARIYEPVAGGRSRATIVWLHGGGWVLGSIEAQDPMCRCLALATGARIVAVDYRLAPEHRYPVPVDDAWAALRWAAGACAEDPLIVGGDSAGGNLAAACALRARDAGGPALDRQLLVYPVLDHDLDTTSYREHGDADYTLRREAMRWFFDLYADPAQRDLPDVSPLRAADLAGLAPAILVVAEYDPLRDESLRYAERLRGAGVDADVLMFDDMHHGFWSGVAEFTRSREAIEAVAARLLAVR